MSIQSISRMWKMSSMVTNCQYLAGLFPLCHTVLISEFDMIPTHQYNINKMSVIHKYRSIFSQLQMNQVLIKPDHQYLLLAFLLLINCCTKEFIPAVREEKELLVVEGLITDQPESNTIKLSKSLPLGPRSSTRPLDSCTVSISDDLGNIFSLKQTNPGTYITDPETFKGEARRSYTLHITTNDGDKILNYESSPSEMKPVPPIDSLYYEKTVIKEKTIYTPVINGCQIFLDTHDPENNCKLFRWDYTETWLIRLPFSIPNQICWVTENSKAINIKSTDVLKEASVIRFPLNYISNVTDRLKFKYSILVNQYSLNEDEYIFWENLQTLAEHAGGLYDIIPASVPSNLICKENPDENVLGYFSVSAKSSKRIFIKDEFGGIIDQYADCITGFVFTDTFPGLGTTAWIILPHVCSLPCISYYDITTFYRCADCTTRGTTAKPAWWQDDKQDITDFRNSNEE